MALAFFRKDPMPVRRVAVITGVDLVGDGLIKLPFLRALRGLYPQAEINWITSHGPSAYASILRELTAPFIDHVLERPAFLPTTDNPKADTSQSPFYDIIFDTRSKWRQALEARRLPHRLFIAQAARFLLSDRRPPFYRGRPRHVLDRMFQLLRLASRQTELPLAGELRLDPALLATAGRLLPAGKTAIGLAPGAGFRPRAWPLENFIKAAIAESAKGRLPVFLLGPAELEWQAPIAAAVPEALFPLQDRASWGSPTMRVEETMALGTYLALAVVNDSGTSHMLGAVDCPLVNLFGPTHATKAAPHVTHQVVVSTQDFGGDRDMQAIPVAAVTRAIDTLLGKAERGARERS